MSVRSTEIPQLDIYEVVEQVEESVSPAVNVAVSPSGLAPIILSKFKTRDPVAVAK